MLWPFLGFQGRLRFPIQARVQLAPFRPAPKATANLLPEAAEFRYPNRLASLYRFQ